MPSEAFEKFLPHLHPTAWVHHSAQLLGDVHLGEDVSVWPTSVLRGDCGRIVVGARTNIQDGTIAHATTGMSQTTIGAQCTIGHRVVLHGCAVGDNCLIGMGSLLLDGVEVGADCFVAAGSLLTPGKKFEARSFVMGAPARRIREVNADELAIIERSWRRYSQLLSSYRK